GALFFNPFSVEEIMNRILMMTLPQVREEYARRGYERYLTIKERQDRDLDALIDYLIADSPG
ncbi:MAG: glycosyltransferase family 1 protein, partial [Prevotellaceae bacterium]|nr:glycosyltransferase family 1 protein [Prevotellaceae bacterium]